jgi:hypothetical protein
MRSLPAAWQAGTARVSHHDPRPIRGDRYRQDNWAAVFYAHISIEMSLPVGSRRKAALFEKTARLDHLCQRISGATSVSD